MAECGPLPYNLNGMQLRTSLAPNLPFRIVRRPGQCSEGLRRSTNDRSRRRWTFPLAAAIADGGGSGPTQAVPPVQA